MIRNNTAPIPDLLYGTAWKEERTAGLTELAIRQGFRGIDTANQRKHYYEIGVGLGLAAAYSAGVVTRADLFLQTKFTYQRGQDHRLPYDAKACLSEQVEQSMASSLEHLGTEYVDSFILHGPASGFDWMDSDAEVWEAMRRARDAGLTKKIGVSNVSIQQLTQMVDLHEEGPTFVQNRCFARLGWDREVRTFCRERAIVYQGFSLLTANPEVVAHSYTKMQAEKHRCTPAQVVFSFARGVGMLALTGTSNRTHMDEDLANRGVMLTPEEIGEIESLVG